MKSRDGKSQRREEKKKEDHIRESLRRKKIQVREKVGKVAKHCVFPMICGSGGSKSRLAKAAGAEPAGQMRDEKLHAVVARSTFASEKAKNITFGALLEVEMSKKCTPLWREAHIEVEMYKAHQVQSIFWSWDVEKVHAVVARSTYRSQNVQSTPGSEHFLKLRCRKSARRCGAKHVSKSKCTKHQGFGPLFQVQMSFRVAGARDCAPCQKWAKREGFVAFPKTMAGVGHLKRICEDAFSVAGAVQETCSSELLGGPSADFLREIAFWSIRSSGLLRWFCVTGAALRMTWHHFFAAGAVV